MKTDEIGNNSSVETAEHIGSYENKFGEQLKSFAVNAAQFEQPFSRTELGDGQAMSVTEHARLVAIHDSRNRAGDAANSQITADLTWAEVRIKEQKLIGKQLERGIQQAKNVELKNELFYQVGRIPLHAEGRSLQLEKMRSQVSRLKQQVKASASHFMAEVGNTEVVEVDFTQIEE